MSKCPLCEEMHNCVTTGIIKEYEHCVVIFNKFPYCKKLGHLLIVPKKHFGKLSDYSYDERCEFMETIKICQENLITVLGIDSVNIGINIGPNSGGSIPSHLHIHVVPRQSNDINFLQMFSDIFPHNDTKCVAEIIKSFEK